MQQQRQSFPQERRHRQINPPIVITGGAQRLGLATARALLGPEQPIVITYRRERPVLDELRQQGIECIQADFSDHAAIEAFNDELILRFPMLRAIIHNASEWLPENGDVDDAEVMQRMLNVHTLAPYLINQRCGKLPRMNLKSIICPGIKTLILFTQLR